MTKGILRVHLAGGWYLEGLVEVFEIVQELHAVRFCVEFPTEQSERLLAQIIRGTFRSFIGNPESDWSYWRDDRLYLPLRPWEMVHRNDIFLRVERISYSSPGFADLVGIGKIVEEIRLFLSERLRLRDERQLRRLNEREKLLDIKAREYELARQFLADLPRLRLGREESERLVRHTAERMERLALYADRSLLRGADKYPSE